MKQFEVIQNTLPEDVALKIVSMLSVRDLCALGCCSRFWRELCGSDCIWESLTRERWPSLVCFDFSASSSSSAPPNAPNFKEWRKLYIEKHNEVAVRAAAAAKFVEESSPSKSLEVGDYLKAISILDDMKLGFKDVQMCLFRPNLKVLVNLVGLHYCLTWLRIPVFPSFHPYGSKLFSTFHLQGNGITGHATSYNLLCPLSFFTSLLLEELPKEAQFKRSRLERF
ncbi:uncharacterized protein LOC129297425 isoform X3 [Prosopis cineraria]|uniref:uncharacterized protein LOC129297425 isoform X3 n=1 Tax=Prosopis cineraria TaxID=364024 RepID=UPI00240FB6A3|nr:uncharacterized protein LOC129297425 isoform X3 [Prosopis cineraria]